MTACCGSLIEVVLRAPILTSHDDDPQLATLRNVTFALERSTSWNGMGNRVETNRLSTLSCGDSGCRRLRRSARATTEVVPSNNGCSNDRNRSDDRNHDLCEAAFHRLPPQGTSQRPVSVIYTIAIWYLVHVWPSAESPCGSRLSVGSTGYPSDCTTLRKAEGRQFDPAPDHK